MGTGVEVEAELQVFVQLSHSPAQALLPVRARGTAELILGPCSVTTLANRAGSWRVLGAAPWGVQRFGSQDLIGVVLPGPGAFLGRASPPPTIPKPSWGTCWVPQEPAAVASTGWSRGRHGPAPRQSPTSLQHHFEVLVQPPSGSDTPSPRSERIWGISGQPPQFG